MPDALPAVFAVPEEILAGFYARPQFCADSPAVHNALDDIRRHGKFYPREWAEQTEEVRQIIPCAVILNGARRLLSIKRAKKGRGDLSLRRTLLFGGHIDEADAQDGDMLQNCVKRELNEELGIRAQIAPAPIGIVADPSTPSSRRHFGVVFQCGFSGDSINTDGQQDDSEFANAGRAQDHLFGEVADFFDESCDPWSSYLLKSDFACQMLGRNFRVQRPLPV